MSLRKTALLPAILLLAVAACGDEPRINPKLLEGRWFIQSGTRDGVESPAFDGAYLFFQGKRMKSNLPLPDPNFTEVPMDFSIKNDVLTQKPEGVEGLDLTITMLTDSLLVLDFELRKTFFHLEFGRQDLRDSIPVGTPME